MGNQIQKFQGEYSRINSTKYPASGAGKWSEPRLVSGKSANSCARKSGCFCSQRGEDAIVPLRT